MFIGAEYWIFLRGNILHEGFFYWLTATFNLYFFSAFLTQSLEKTDGAASGKKKRMSLRKGRILLYKVYDKNILQQKITYIFLNRSAGNRSIPETL